MSEIPYRLLFCSKCGSMFEVTTKIFEDYSDKKFECSGCDKNNLVLYTDVIFNTRINGSGYKERKRNNADIILTALTEKFDADIKVMEEEKYKRAKKLKRKR